MRLPRTANACFKSAVCTSGSSIAVPIRSFGGAAAADFVTAGLMNDCRSFPGGDYQMNWRDEPNRYSEICLFSQNLDRVARCASYLCNQEDFMIRTYSCE